MMSGDIDRIETIKGYPVVIKDPPDNLTEEELGHYVDRAISKCGDRLSGIELRFYPDDPDYVGIDYVVKNTPFSRIRRITGYLVGDMSRWNDAKAAEEADRVKHG